MDRDFRAFLETPDPGVKTPRRRRGYNAFGWTVCLLLLTGGVMASWIASFYVFSHPENPDCYQFLKKLNRIEPLKRFEVTSAPPGTFFTAKELYDTYIMMTPEVLADKNNELLRNYLRNYTDTKTPVPYIWGRFTTTGVYELGKPDLFPSGMVAVADSVDCPAVRIEHVYPTAFANVARARQMLATDPEINLEKTFDLSSVVHVEKEADGRITFTVLPLAYGQYAYKQGISSTFRLDPPSSVNLEAGMPVVKGDELEKAAKTFALYRKNKGMLAKGKLLTLPEASPAPLQTTDFYTAQDIPPEAYQPLKPAIADSAPAPAVESAPENTVAANAPVVMPPAKELQPVISTPSSAEAEPVAPQAAPAPGPPVLEAAEPPPTAAVSQSAPVPAAASVPAIAKISLPSAPPVTASAAPATPALSRAAAPVKLEKPAVKTTASVLPTPAPAVRQLFARNQPSPTPAATTQTAAVSRPKVSTYASAPQTPVKSVVAPAPQPVVERAEPYPSPAPVEYADAVPPESPSGVKLDPFLAGQPKPAAQQWQPRQAQLPPPVQLDPEQAAAPAKTTMWPLYRPGMMPRGKLINAQNAPQLADLGIGRERVYVNGRFIVTAASDGRAVLRPVDYNSGASESSVRMVVEYPAGTRIPAEGTEVARGPLRPFQVVDVRRGDDGQVNVYAREITEPASQSEPYVQQRYNQSRMVQRDNASFY